MSPVDGAELCINGKVECVVDRGSDTTAGERIDRGTVHMLVVLVLKPLGRVSSVNLGAMVGNRGNMVESVIVVMDWYVVVMLVVW